MFQCHASLGPASPGAKNSAPYLYAADKELALLPDYADQAQLIAARQVLQGLPHTLARQAPGNWLAQDGDPVYLLQLANRLLLARFRRGAGSAGCGLTVFCADAETVLLAQIGALQGWRIREGRLEPLGPGQLDAAAGSRLGEEEFLEPALYSEPRRPGQRYLLLSANLAEALEPDTLEGLLEDHGPDHAAALAAMTRAAPLAGVQGPCGAYLLQV
ncbi:hypothetical protein [Alkalilimnicola sp. S0819]|uniref:hypothetical protein n=1 Tax=Alkalilimnicola sp. S0819 TaxID=2613922 RepID=UPI001262444F|nr:hypothetical protein [Alkalilimnicola sp. S0819]KAB7628380.1 hypothetical protein F3N43_01390 [Alkalilimnicola sp. S0819]MPQ15283.1 hypothetical protein [Alkalilimnicola sp. S0819]